MNLELQFVLLGWGTLVGLDLVSVPQMMIARPLVAGAVAGAILGDIRTGLQLGVIFELFQYDILPVGAVRYPEYGPATVAAVAAAHAGPGLIGIGLGTVAGLLMGMVGGLSLHTLRRLNARAVHRASASIESGDVAALLRAHVAGLLRDAARSALVTAVGLVVARAARALFAGALSPLDVTVLGIAAVAGALAAGASGTFRLVGRGPSLRWFAAGLGGGALVAWLR